MLKNKSEDGSGDSWDENGGDDTHNFSGDDDIEISIASNFENKEDHK